MGAIFHVYLQSRSLIKETTRFSSVIRISSVYSHREIQLLGKFLSVQAVTRAGMHADRDIPYLLS